MSAPVVLNAPDADLDIQQSTIFGKLTGRTLEASDTIFTAHVKIARRQEGCIRFSYLPQGSRTPRRYRCAPDRTLLLEAEHQGPLLTAEEQAAIRARIQPRFTSSAFGSPAFGQLSLVCAAEISAGGDGGAEMGAYNSLGEPFRRANLRDALDEYLPLGLQAGIIFVS
jgi:hypothetical protein